VATKWRGERGEHREQSSPKQETNTHESETPNMTSRSGLASRQESTGETTQRLLEIAIGVLELFAFPLPTHRHNAADCGEIRRFITSVMS
jgi:hypothetical protein